MYTLKFHMEFGCTNKKLPLVFTFIKDVSIFDIITNLQQFFICCQGIVIKWYIRHILFGVYIFLMNCLNFFKNKDKSEIYLFHKCISVLYTCNCTINIKLFSLFGAHGFVFKNQLLSNVSISHNSFFLLWIRVECYFILKLLRIIK